MIRIPYFIRVDQTEFYLMLINDKQRYVRLCELIYDKLRDYGFVPLLPTSDTEIRPCCIIWSIL